MQVPAAPAHAPPLDVSDQGAAIATSFCVLVLAAALAILGFGSYTRKTSIDGFVAPQAGATPLVSLRAARVLSVSAREGDLVSPGRVLMKLSTDERLDSGEALSALVSDANRRRAVALEVQARSEQALLASDLAGFREQRRSAREKLDGLRRSRAIAAERMAVSQDRVDKAAALHARGFVSGVQLQAWQDAALQARLSVEGLDQEIGEASSLERKLGLSIDASASRSRQASAKAETAWAENQERQAELDSVEVSIAAPAGGRVSALRVRPGDAVTAGQTLATILPTTGGMEVVLWASSRSIGQIRPGNPVKLSYEAFPVQSFGFQNGVVADVEKSPSAPPGPDDGVRDPRFRVIVRVEDSELKAFGARWPLVVGMKTTGVVSLERRPLWAWLLDPLAKLRARYAG